MRLDVRFSLTFVFIILMLDQINTFIVSTEVENILKQVFCASVLQMQSPSLSQIQQEFTQLFSLHTGIAVEKLEDTAALLFKLYWMDVKKHLTRLSIWV